MIAIFLFIIITVILFYFSLLERRYGYVVCVPNSKCFKRFECTVYSLEDSLLSISSREENKSKGMLYFDVYSFLFMSLLIPPTNNKLIFSSVSHQL